MAKELITRSEFARRAGCAAASITNACKPGKALHAATEGKRINANHPDAVAYLEKQAQANQPAPADGIDPLYQRAVDTCKADGRWSRSHLQRALKVSYHRAAKIFAMMEAAGIVPSGSEPPPPVKQPKPAAPVDPTPEPYVRGHVAKKEREKQEYVAPQADDLPEHIHHVADLTLRELIARFGSETRFGDWLKALKAIEEIREKRNKNEEKERSLIPRDLVTTHVIGQFDQAHTNLLTDGAQTLAALIHAKVKAGADVNECEDLIKNTISRNLKGAQASIARVLSNA